MLLKIWYIMFFLLFSFPTLFSISNSLKTFSLSASQPDLQSLKWYTSFFVSFFSVSFVICTNNISCTKNKFLNSVFVYINYDANANIFKEETLKFILDFSFRNYKNCLKTVFLKLNFEYPIHKKAFLVPKMWDLNCLLGPLIFQQKLP